MNQTIHNQPTTIYGEGDSVRAFTYIDDILPCLLTAATSEKCSKQIINLGAIKGYSIKEANDLFKEIEPSVTTIHLEPRYEVKHAVPAHEKSVEYLEYEDKTSLKEGLAKM
jgi:nucleoside-diphosphate-sugar epimerase